MNTSESKRTQETDRVPIKKRKRERTLPPIARGRTTRDMSHRRRVSVTFRWFRFSAIFRRSAPTRTFQNPRKQPKPTRERGREDAPDRAAAILELHDPRSGPSETRVCRVIESVDGASKARAEMVGRGRKAS